MTSEAILALSRGGLGVALTLTNPGDVVQVNSGITAFTTGPSPVPPALRVISFNTFI